MTDDGASALLSPEQVARRCGLSRRAVYRAIERGELRASRLCSRLRIRSDDLAAWIVASRVTAVRLSPAAPTASHGLAATNGLRRLLDEGEPSEES